VPALREKNLTIVYYVFLISKIGDERITDERATMFPEKFTEKFTENETQRRIHWIVRLSKSV
jgi:hypothetical protein